MKTIDEILAEEPRQQKRRDRMFLCFGMGIGLIVAFLIIELTTIAYNDVLVW